MTRIATLLHRLALLFYPRAFRNHFGHDLREIFRWRIEGALASGRARAILLAAWLLADAVQSGLAERQAPHHAA